MKYPTLLYPLLALLIAVLAGVSTSGEMGAMYQPESSSFKAPKLISYVRPDPVEYAPGRTIEGFVTLEIKVGLAGEVMSARVLHRTSYLAVRSAIRAVEKWNFTPGSFEGKPVISYVVYSLPFGRNLPIFADKNYPNRVLDPATGEEIALK